METETIEKKESKVQPKLRFKEFDQDWKKVKLGDLGQFRGGGTPDTKIKKYWSGEIPWISSSDIYEGDIHNINIHKWINENAIKETATKVIPKESILLISRVGVGKLAINKEELCTSQDFSNFLPNDNNSYFLGYYLISRKNLLIGFAQGTSIKGFTTSDIKNLKLKIPSLPEQQKITSFLSAVDKKIQQLTRKKGLLETYKKGVMQQLFLQEVRFKDEDGKNFPEWEKKTLKDILISYRLGGNYTNTDAVTAYPLIKMGNLGRGKINLNKVEYIPIEEQLDQRDKLKFGDLLFNTRNTLELVGKVSIWQNELPVAYYNSNLMYLKFENNFFMNYRLNSYEGIKALKRFATGTTSVAAIYTKDLLKVKLQIPSFEEQQKIADFLSAIDKKIEAVSQQIEKTHSFKKGLLQQMFV